MLDDLAEIGTAAPWIWRGWVYLFSSRYRHQQNHRWQTSSGLIAGFDILATLAFFLVELVFLSWAVLGVFTR